MTEKEAIEYLSNKYLVVGSPVNPPKEECEKHNAVLDMAIKALEEIQQYRAIGTVEELKTMKENGAFTGVELASLACMQMKLKDYQVVGTVEEFKALKEKAEPKKPKKKNSNKVIVTQDSYAYCPHCKNPVQIWNRSCEKCGGELDWH